MTFFWCYIDFLRFIHVIVLLTFFACWFTSWSNFISYLISNQITSCFCSLLNDSFRGSICSIYSNVFNSFQSSVHYFFPLFITKLFCKQQKAILLDIFSFFWLNWVSYLYILAIVALPKDKCHIHIIFNVKRTTILISKPQVNESKFCINGI